MFNPQKRSKLSVMRWICIFMAFTVAVGYAVANEPSWPADLDERVAELEASVKPSGRQAASVSVSQVHAAPTVTEISAGVGSVELPFDSVYCFSRTSTGINMISFPIGSVICIR